MAQFVLIANGITTIQLEKALEIKIRSGNRMNFIVHVQSWAALFFLEPEYTLLYSGPRLNREHQ